MSSLPPPPSSLPSSTPIALVDFVKSVPQPLTAVLVQLSPFIAVIRHGFEITSWCRLWYESWLAVALWWAICLLVERTLRYFIPVVILVATIVPPRPPRPTTTTEQSLQKTISDLSTIQSLLPSLPALPAPKIVLRVTLITYVPYLLLTYFVPLRILLAVLGTFLLIARAPFTHVISITLQRSAWIRWSLRHITAFLTGQPLPPVILSQQPTPTTPTPVPSLRFLFTIYENQRWWMGLDWTAALLPGERPSWSSSPPNFQPLSPPSAFTLPPPTTVYLANGKGGRVKRTATWHWEEPEWRVVVRKDGGGLSRVERPIPEESPAASGGSGSRLLKAAGKMRESGIIGGSSTGNANTTGGLEGETGVGEGPEDANEDSIATDADGWVYGDNKWEGSSNKGGMGKYTRHRRWTRVAIVSEMVEVVEDGPVGIERPEVPAPPEPITLAAPPQDVVTTATPSISGEEDSPLKQRLRRALSKPSTGGT